MWINIKVRDRPKIRQYADILDDAKCKDTWCVSHSVFWEVESGKDSGTDTTEHPQHHLPHPRFQRSSLQEQTVPLDDFWDRDLFFSGCFVCHSWQSRGSYKDVIDWNQALLLRAVALSCYEVLQCTFFIARLYDKCKWAIIVRGCRLLDGCSL